MNNSLKDYETIRNSYKTAAQIVWRFGEIYLPIFERLHAELDNMELAATKKASVLGLVEAAL